MVEGGLVINMMTSSQMIPQPFLPSLSGLLLLPRTETCRLKPNERVSLPRNRIRRWCYQFSINNIFDNVMMFIVVFNLAVLAAVHYNMSEEQIMVSEQLNYFFSACYIAEALIKIIALGWRTYWTVSERKDQRAPAGASLRPCVAPVIDCDMHP